MMTAPSSAPNGFANHDLQYITKPTYLRSLNWVFFKQVVLLEGDPTASERFWVLFRLHFFPGLN